MKTNQEIFNQVAAHLLAQNEQCVFADQNTLPDGELIGSCAYRNTYGQKCAVGCLIPDDKYDPAIEGAGVLWLTGVPRNQILRDILVSEGVVEKSFALLRQLQNIHDGYHPGEWAPKLLALANKFQLTFEVPDED